MNNTDKTMFRPFSKTPLTRADIASLPNPDDAPRVLAAIAKRERKAEAKRIAEEAWKLARR